MTETATAPVSTPPLPPRAAAPPPPVPQKPSRRKPLVVPTDDEQDRPPGYVPPTSLMASFGVSMLVHLVILLGLAFWMLGVKPADLALLIDGSSKVGIKTELEDDPKISLEQDGGGARQNPTAMIANQVIERPVNDGKLPTSIVESIKQFAAKDDGKGAKSGTGEGEGEATAPNGGAKTGNAVTKGPFTVWTNPQSPLLGQMYLIYVEVRVPKDILEKKPELKTRFPVTDLKGTVSGDADRYTQVIPWDPDLQKSPDPRFIRHTYRQDPRTLRLTWLSPLSRYKFLPAKNGVARLVIKVPGSQVPKTTDTIELESTLLDKKSTLKLEFQTKKEKRKSN